MLGFASGYPEVLQGATVRPPVLLALPGPDQHVVPADSDQWLLHDIWLIAEDSDQPKGE